MAGRNRPARASCSYCGGETPSEPIRGPTVHRHEGCSMKKFRTRHVVTPFVVFGALVAGLTGSGMAASTEMPGGTNFQPSSAYVAPTAAGTKLGQYNIARFK